MITPRGVDNLPKNLLKVYISINNLKQHKLKLLTVRDAYGVYFFQQTSKGKVNNENDNIDCYLCIRREYKT